MSLEETLDKYIKFHEKVEVTPLYFSLPDSAVADLGRSRQFQRMFHGALGMPSEASEVLELFKKNLYGKRTPIDMEKLKLEMGDVFWYFTLICRASGLTLEEIMLANMNKLAERYPELAEA